MGVNVGYMFLVIGFLCMVDLTRGQYVDMRSVSEGNCPYSGFPAARNLNRTWFEQTRFTFIPAGSKYHLYRISTGAVRTPRSFFVNLVEHEFPFNVCLRTQLDPQAGRGSIYSRGQLINDYIVSRPDPNEARVIDFTPIPQPSRGVRDYDVSRHHVTLTDNYSFVVFANCWTRSYQQSWDVLSTTPYLSPQTKDIILDHIGYLGFDKRLAVFLEYDRC